MTEQAKSEQLGELVEQWNILRGELNRVEERLEDARAAFAILGDSRAFASLSVENQAAVCLQPPEYRSPKRIVPGAVSYGEVVDLVKLRDDLAGKLAKAAARLKRLAPHLPI